jgi:CxxC-x17-CxxC domain-containing protein
MVRGFHEQPIISRMNQFRKPHGGGGNRGFGGGSGRPSFGGGGRPLRPPFSREENGQKFDATCAECGKPCQVPFRPNGKKPVYCSNCFATQRGESPRAPHGDDRAFADVKRQIDILTSKVDVIMRMLQDSHRTVPPAAVSTAPIVAISSPPALPIKNPKGTFRADAAKKKTAKKKGPAKR